jgi:hypothetical protein
VAAVAQQGREHEAGGLEPALDHQQVRHVSTLRRRGRER